MKPQIHSQKRDQGSVLLVTMLVTAIMGITLASYLIMIQTQNTSVVRSQTWNSSIAITEAGIEDALQLINKNSGNFMTLTNWPATAALDNWALVGPNLYYVRRYIGEDYYDVYVTNASTINPSVCSQGHAKWYNTFALAGTPTIGTVGVTLQQNANVNRNVSVLTKIDPIFNVAMAALKTIDFSGKNIQTDGFDSGDPAYSNNGLYPLGNPSKTKASGDVVTDEVITNSLGVGNAKIRGQVKTGPKGTVQIGPGGSVGDKAWVDGGSLGIQPGYSAADMNVAFPDVTAPIGSFLPATSGNYTVNGNSYKYVFNVSGDYTISSLTGSIYIGTNAHVRLKITGSVNLTGANDAIFIDSSPTTSGSLQIYMYADSFSIKGQGIVNTSGNAANFTYLGMPSNTSVTFGGNATFTGSIYAPSANFTLGGGGSNPIDFIGASVTKTVKMNGHFNFHYDENLRRNGMGRGFIPTNWKET
jgi:hypothetical protein